MNVVFIHTLGVDEAVRLSLGGNVMLAARIISAFHLPSAHQVSLKVLVCSRADMEIVPSAFVFPERKPSWIYIMGKEKFRIPKPYWRLDK